jgi:hypothetical protein
MTEQEALNLYAAVSYNLTHPRLKEAVDIAFGALRKQVVPDEKEEVK